MVATHTILRRHHGDTFSLKIMLVLLSVLAPAIVPADSYQYDNCEDLCESGSLITEATCEAETDCSWDEDADPYVYYCSNDGAQYAEYMGGISCPEGAGNTPTCPNGQDCVCTDIDGYCTDGDDDWSYKRGGTCFSSVGSSPCNGTISPSAPQQAYCLTSQDWQYDCGPEPYIGSLTCRIVQQSCGGCTDGSTGSTYDQCNQCLSVGHTGLDGVATCDGSCTPGDDSDPCFKGFVIPPPPPTALPPNYCLPSQDREYDCGPEPYIGSLTCRISQLSCDGGCDDSSAGSTYDQCNQCLSDGHKGLDAIATCDGSCTPGDDSDPCFKGFIVNNSTTTPPPPGRSLVFDDDESVSTRLSVLVTFIVGVARCL